MLEYIYTEKHRKLRNNYDSDCAKNHITIQSPSPGDLLQPVLKKKKTVSIPRPRDLRSRDVDRYCLQHQEEDSEGDVKTELYKV